VDPDVVSKLQAAGIELSSPNRAAYVRVERDERSAVVSLRDTVTVSDGRQEAVLTLRPLAESFVGSRVPPGFADGPTPHYVPFFMFLERTVVEYCRAARRPERDEELDRIFRQLRRRPDGQDKNPLFAYLRAAACVYVGAVDTSRAEFEAVLQRLSRSASRFGTNSTSTNYVATIADTFPD